MPANTQSPNSHRRSSSITSMDNNDFAHSTTTITTPKPKFIVTSEPYPEQASQKTPTTKSVVIGKNGLPIKSALKGPSSPVPRSSTIHSYSSPCNMTSHKYVHFNSQLEHVRLFLQGETPSCVGEREIIVDARDATTSNIQLALPNWTPVTAGSFQPGNIDAGAAPLRVETVTLSDDQTELKGKILIQNIAFHKHVSVRFTTDFWQTQSEISAEFAESIPGSPLDRFTFVIPLNMEKAAVEKTFCIAVRYQVIGREFWDSNNGMNYQVECKRVVVAQLQNSKDVSKQINNILLTSRPDYGNPVLKKKGGRYDLSSSLSAAFQHPVKVAHTPANQTAYRPSEYITPQSPPGYHTSLYASSPKFASPYLSAASPPEHIHLGFERLSLDPISKRGTRNSWAAREIEPIGPTRSQSLPPTLETTSPIAIPSSYGNRPAVGSSSYYDLVDRYCFYESSPHTSSYSSYPNSPPATCIRGFAFFAH
ncbi:hypothetical protein BGZ74_001359 [Mortierella antarctica]|nr:hypothetical protein BGZ74_001359 [Mortierella antarctica]